MANDKIYGQIKNIFEWRKSSYRIFVPCLCDFCRQSLILWFFVGIIRSSLEFWVCLWIFSKIFSRKSWYEHFVVDYLKDLQLILRLRVLFFVLCWYFHNFMGIFEFAPLRRVFWSAHVFNLGRMAILLNIRILG